MNIDDFEYEASDDANGTAPVEVVAPSPATIRAQRNDRLFGVMVGMILLLLLGVQFLRNDTTVRHPAAVATATTNGYANIFSVPGNQAAFPTSPANNSLNLPLPVTPPPQAPVRPAATATAVPAATATPSRNPSPTTTPTPNPIATPLPTPTSTPLPTSTPAPTITPAPTSTPAPTATPAPTNTPNPTLTPPPTLSPTALPQPTATIIAAPTATTLP